MDHIPEHPVKEKRKVIKMTSDNITVIMKPTNQCNLRCKYCYHADNGYDKEKMTDQVLEKAIAVTSATASS